MAETDEKQTEKKPRRKPRTEEPRTAVRIVEHQGNKIVVEWFDADSGTYHRALQPLTVLSVDETIKTSILNKAKPYGEAWEEMIALKTSPDLIANELRRRGIWTLDDLNTKRQAALGAFRAILADDFAAFLQTADAVKQ